MRFNEEVLVARCPLKNLQSAAVFLCLSSFFSLFAKPALFQILLKALVPDIMASMGVKIEFF